MNTWNNAPEKELETKTKELLATLRVEALEPSPFLKTRVLARLREERAETLTERFTAWKRTLAGALTFGAMILGAIVLVPSNQNPALNAVAGIPVSIKLDIGVQDKQVSYAAIELSNGVHFYSRKYPNVRERRSLRLPVRNELGKNLPIIVRADELGLKSVKVRYFSQENQLVAEREVKINFQETVERG